MPYIDIDLDDIYSDLSRHEKENLMDWLREDGYLKDYVAENATEFAFRSKQLTNEPFVLDCISLGEAFYRMSDADIQIVRDMVNKYKYY